MRDLTEIREDINAIDKELLELFARRMDCAKEVAAYKKANNIPILNEKREQEILDRVYEQGGEYGSYAREMFRKLMEFSRDLQSGIIAE